MFLPYTNDFIMAREVYNEISPSTNQNTSYSPPASNYFNKTKTFVPQLEIRWTSLGGRTYGFKYTGKLLWDTLRKIPSEGPEDPLTPHCKNSFCSWEADGINRLLHLSIVLKQSTCESLCPLSEDRLYILSRDKNICRYSTSFRNSAGSLCFHKNKTKKLAHGDSNEIRGL